MTVSTVSASAVYFDSTRKGSTAVATINSPPIVGVPCLTTCAAGPSARICCPRFLWRSVSMNFGPITMAATIASKPAIRAGTRAPRTQERPGGIPRLLGPRRPHGGPVPPCGLAHAEHLDVELRGELADRAVVLLRGLPELGHLAQDRHAPAT